MKVNHSDPLRYETNNSIPYNFRASLLLSKVEPTNSLYAYVQPTKLEPSNVKSFWPLFNVYCDQTIHFEELLFIYRKNIPHAISLLFTHFKAKSGKNFVRRRLCKTLHDSEIIIPFSPLLFSLSDDERSA